MPSDSVYPELKPSGVDWLGDVPAHWNAFRLKFLIRAKITDGPHLTPNFIDSGVPFLSVDGIQDGELVFEGCRYISESDHEEYKIKALPKKNDILLGKAASTGKIARVKVDFEFSIWSPLALIKPDEEIINATFLEFAFKSQAAQAQIDVLCTSNTQKNISMDEIPVIWFAVPPTLEEQQAIADYLDRKTAQIDAVVREKARQIELLGEHRQALISHAVTRGINPATPVKPSGIAWLGDVPTHWAVIPLKRIAALKSGDTINSDSISDNGEFPVYGGNGQRGFTGDYTHDGTYPLIGRQGALCGNVNYAAGKFWASEHAVVVSVKRETDIFWLGETLRAMNLNQYAVSAAQPGLSVEVINNLAVPVPPLSEQREIAEHLDRETTRIDGIVQTVQSQIERLREYRQAVISAAVTGKIAPKSAG